jgi:predicted O-linked N-acetylglucosamine transferase (SPINDLY family)
MSHLTVLGLIESIAENKDDYIAVARKLADDIEFLTTLRLSLRDRMAASPLCDGIKFTNNLEVVYREMWRKYVSDHKGIKSCQ